MEKNSFTLIETILSLVLVSIMLGGFSKLLFNTNDFKIYNNLHNAQNEFILTNDINTSYDEFKFKN